MIRPGREWGSPASGEAAIDVHGDDAALARAVAAQPGALVRFFATPASDLARAVGLDPLRPPTTELPLDALRLDGADLAANMVVVGRPPDSSRRFFRRICATVAVDGVAWWEGSAAGIVVATGEFLRGHDVVPRGHPGDGRAEIQIYALRRREHRVVRARLATGTHVPHPSIAQRSGHRFEIATRRPAPVEVDGRARDAATTVTVEVVPNAYRLLV